MFQKDLPTSHDLSIITQYESPVLIKYQKNKKRKSKKKTPMFSPVIRKNPNPVGSDRGSKSEWNDIFKPTYLKSFKPKINLNLPKQLPETGQNQENLDLEIGLNKLPSVANTSTNCSFNGSCNSVPHISLNIPSSSSKKSVAEIFQADLDESSRSTRKKKSTDDENSDRESKKIRLEESSLNYRDFLK